MNPAKRKRLTAAGWKVGTVGEFLGLSLADSQLIELKLRLSRALARQRSKGKLTQVQAAKLLGSSQSRVAKMESGDPSVSADLLIRSLLALGATTREVASAVSAGPKSAASSAHGRRPPRAGTSRRGSTA